MDALPAVLDFIRELIVPLLVFGALFVYSIIRGQRALTSIILSLYISLLVSLEFPYYELLYQKLTFASKEGINMVMFAIFTALGTILFEKILSRLLDETAFEGIWKKLVLAILGTTLLMAYSYHVLPVTQFIDPGAQIAQVFAPQSYFFWWLMLPLLGLFFVF